MPKRTGTSKGSRSTGGRTNVTSGDGKLFAPGGKRTNDASTAAGGYKTGPKHKGPENGPMGHSVQNAMRMPARSSSPGNLKGGNRNGFNRTGGGGKG